MIYRPTYIEKITPFIDAPFVKILTGVRRSGKSTILQMIREELKKRGIKDAQIISYNFDSLQYENIKTASELYSNIKNNLYSKGRTYLFLDEIQEVSDWEKAVNSFMTDFDVDIFVTGSNSRMMSSEIETYLTGRYVSFRVYPLSFSEYLDFRKNYTAAGAIRDEFIRYLKFGGFPAIHLKEYTQDEAYTIIKDIYNATIFTDIVKRNQIRKVDLLERVVKFTFGNVGQTFSAAFLSKYLRQHRTII